MSALANELDIDKVLGADGIIREQIPGFVSRKSQLEMASLIHQSIDSGKSQIIEASTGIGKSFAYLVPAFLCDGKVIISTGTRNLQDQLYQKDIPLIRKTIISPRKTALLKGRSNYCCKYRVDKFRRENRYHNAETASIFELLSQWSEASKTGDISEFSELPENDPLWFYATSNADNCLGSECPDYQECFVVKARREALDADIVVINHHLYFSDRRLREEGFGEILPEADVLIFDESHQLPDVASHFYGNQLSMRQFELLSSDITDAELNEASESKDCRKQTDLLKKSVRDFRLSLGQFPEKAEWQRIHNAPPLKLAVDSMLEVLDQTLELLKSMTNRGKELANCHRRLETLKSSLDLFLSLNDQTVSWYEWNERGFRLQVSPVDISDSFRTQLDELMCQSVIFTSATLSTQQSFQYYANRLGLSDIETAQFESPFDFSRQAMLYLPQNLPDPSDQNYATQFGELCHQLIMATQGHCFILFTSYRMLRLTAEYLDRRIDYPLLIQGDVQRNELMAQYLKKKNPVLLGTSSFWEGVDVKGDQLRCVIIDKLPFKSPQDPVYKKRLQNFNQAGGNAFMEIQIPEATISLRQGVGRLIRDQQDQGIVAICDNRLHTKAYGKSILQSLPAMPQTNDMKAVLRFCTEKFNT